MVTHSAEVAEQFDRVERLEEINPEPWPPYESRRPMSLLENSLAKHPAAVPGLEPDRMSMALGVMLVVAVLAIHGVVAESFRSNASLGYNMIVGAKGGSCS